MKRTIIFLSGLAVPRFISKSKYVWNDSLWSDFNCFYLNSNIPSSDVMVENELKYLTQLVNSFTDPIVAGHSLGAWWGANLACQKEAKFKQLVMLTPLGDTSNYPIFNNSAYFHPWNRVPNKNNYGPHKVLVNIAKKDLIVPSSDHSDNLVKHFNALTYHLDGGHFYQKNHDAMLDFMREWINLC